MHLRLGREAAGPAKAAALERRVAGGGLAHVTVKSYLCFGGCQQGPNLVVYRQRTWYASWSGTAARTSRGARKTGAALAEVERLAGSAYPERAPALPGGLSGAP